MIALSLSLLKLKTLQVSPYKINLTIAFGSYTRRASGKVILQLVITLDQAIESLVR